MYRDSGYAYGIDCGDGFMDVNLSPSLFVHIKCTVFVR